jgi:short-subunit dehydrogenase
LQPDPFEAVNGASKAFVRHFADSIREEIKESGVTVTTLMPGPTDTNFFHRAGMDDTKVGSDDKKDDPADVARQGVRALLDGKDSIVAGSLKTKVQTAVVTAVPTSMKGEIHRSMAEPGTATS